MTTYPVQQPSDPEEVAFRRTYGAWAVIRPTDVRNVLAGFDEPWWVAGGWAIDAFTDSARDHDDIDVSIFRRDLPALRTALDGRLHIWSAGDGALRPVVDKWPEPHPDADQVWLREDASSPWLVDVLLNPDQNGAWVNRRDQTMVRPLDEVSWIADDGVRYLNPEIVLIFKAKLTRPKDRIDLDRTLPLLAEAQRRLLEVYLEQEHPGHEWLTLLR